MRHLRSKLAVAFASLVLSLGVVELLLRFAIEPATRGNLTAVPRWIKMEATFPGVPWMLRPNATVTQKFHGNDRGYFDENASLTYRINALGFRGPAFSPQKADKVFRIIGLGDSFTFGTGVRERDTFLASLRQDLSSDSKGRFEVMNLGVMGFDTHAEVALLRYVGLRYRPDLAVICLTLGDAGGGAANLAFNYRVEDDELPEWRRRFRSANRVLALIESRRAMRELIESYDRSFAEGSAGRARVQNALQYAVNLGERFEFRLVLMIFPTLWELSGDHPFLSVHESIAELAAELEIPLLDLLPYFQGFDGPELWVHPSNQHPNEVAHAIAGRALADFLRAQGLLPDGS